MKIVVFVKQVPDNTKLKFDANGPVLEGVPMMINPYDEYALETALRIKEKAGGDSTVTVLSVGAGSAKEVIKKAISFGADDAFLLSDASFDKSDSTANAFALAQGVKHLVPDYQVLVFGQQSLDDVSGQTGPKVAEFLGLPSLTFCKNAELVDNALTVTRETERGVETHKMTLPGVVCMMKCDYELRTSNIKGVMRANKTEIPIKTPADLSLTAAQVGEAGSATSVTKTWKPAEKTSGTIVDGSNPKAAVDQLLTFLKDSKVL
ncbi:MAG: electron transfer flavoprotein subunit beta/FixA family protein [Cyanobacteria bacterium]|nr:electron transfer flavoprotein subunit beta/FixA family protein [Cyanobacteriota bacterium]